MQSTIEGLIQKAKHLSLSERKYNHETEDVETLVAAHYKLLDETIMQIVEQASTFDHASEALRWSEEDSEPQKLAFAKAHDLAVTVEQKSALAELVMDQAIHIGIYDADIFLLNYKEAVIRDTSLAISFKVILEALDFAYWNYSGDVEEGADSKVFARAVELATTAEQKDELRKLLSSFEADKLAGATEFLAQQG